MKIYVRKNEEVLAEMEIVEHRSTLFVNSSQIQKALSPLPIEQNRRMDLDPETAFIVLEQLLPSLQVMDPILEQSINSPGLTFNRILNALDDRKILIADLGLNLAYGIDYETGAVTYILESGRFSLKNKKLVQNAGFDKKLPRKLLRKPKVRAGILSSDRSFGSNRAMLQPTLGDLRVKKYNEKEVML